MRFELIISLLVILLAGTSQAITISVPGDYPSIQAAIDVAEGGDVIEVEGGIYRENVDVNKPLTLRGVGMPTIDAGGDGSAIILSANGISIEGFVATNASNGFGDAGIKVSSNDNSIKTNNASGNGNYGIFLDMSSNNTVEGNNACYNDFGIYLQLSNNNTIKVNNASFNNFGSGLVVSSNNSIHANDIRKNELYGIIAQLKSQFNTITDNQIERNEIGLFLDRSSFNALIGNNVSNSNLSIALSASNNNTIIDNNATGNNFGFRLYSSNNNILKRNIANNNDHGINLDKSRDNVMRDNVMSNNRYNFGADFEIRADSLEMLRLSQDSRFILFSPQKEDADLEASGNNDIDTSNLVDEKSIYYLVDKSDVILDPSSNAGLVYCIDCQNVTLNDLTLKNNTYSVYLVVNR